MNLKRTAVAPLSREEDSVVRQLEALYPGSPGKQLRTWIESRHVRIEMSPSAPGQELMLRLDSLLSLYFSEWDS